MASTGTFYSSGATDDGAGYAQYQPYDNNLAYFTFGDRIGDPYIAFVRFVEIGIPKGAAISSAYVTFTSYSSYATTRIDTNLHFEAADDGTRPANFVELDGLPLTSGTAWDNLPAWSDGVQYDTSDIKAELQDIVDRAGWSSGNAVTLIIKNDRDDNAARRARGYKYYLDYSSPASRPALRVTWDRVNLDQELSESVAIGDTMDAFNLSDALGETVTLGDEMDAFNLSDGLGETVTLGDSMDAEVESPVSISETVTLGDTMDAYCESSADAEANIVYIGDTMDAFNWTSWFRDNAGRAARRYYCTLTGDGDGLDDIVIPISSFQGRIRQGDPTWLSVVVPGTAYSDQIIARSHGEIVVEMAYVLNGSVVLREEIARVEIENIRSDEGTSNASITLSGHKTETWSPKYVELPSDSYWRESEGKITARCAVPDLYLRPGDICTGNSQQFICGYLTYSVSAGGYSVMEVTEA